MGDARTAALHALFRVAHQSAFAAAALQAEIRREGLDRRDAALATEIVYGALRVLPSLDDAIAPHLRSEIGQVDAFALAALRTGAYQLRHLRAPPFAAVDHAVAAVKRKRSKALAGFVNAVLRKVGKHRPEHPMSPTRIELPEWLSEELRASLGEDRARIFVEARPLPPPIGLRCRKDRSAILERLAEALPDAEFVGGAASPVAIRVRRAGDPSELPGFEVGDFVVQEQGAQLVGLSLGAVPGERVADACAGRGGKTALLADAVKSKGDGPDGAVVALELHESKLERLDTMLRRLGHDLVETRAADLTVGLAGLEDRFDRVLVDAPCSGVGTLHRRPELLLRTSEGTVQKSAALQKKILATAAGLVRPGGVLVYAVCSPLRAEGEEVVDAFGAAHRDFRLEPQPVGDIAPDPDGGLRIGPWIDECDGYQAFRFRRVTHRPLAHTVG
ncbi:MAG: transcription antitermination factor NusB [Myxococcota bacterium]